MLTHGKIWTAIDALARRYGLTPSGLAKRAGLDATAFNPQAHHHRRAPPLADHREPLQGALRHRRHAR